MTLYDIKPGFQALLRPIAARLFRAGVRANQVTVGACIISIAFGVWLASAASTPVVFLLIPVWLFMRMAFNAIDGVLAREFGQASSLGAYLNELADVISDCALYLPFALLPGSSVWLVLPVILLSILSEMAGVLGVMVGASRRYDGPMGKCDRAFAFGFLGVLVGFGTPIGQAFAAIWGVLALLIGATVVNRVRKGLEELLRAQ